MENTESWNKSVLSLVPFGIMYMLDYVLTYLEIYAEIGTEANPFMGWFFEMDFQTGVLTRALCCGIIILVMWLCRESKLYRFAVGLVTIMNGLVILWHMVGLFIVGI